MNRRLASAGLVAGAATVAAGVFAWRVVGNRSKAAPAPAGAAGAVDYFFSLNLDDPDGTRRPLSAWRGKILVVNFWATWCAPCVEEMPRLQALADQFKSANVAVLGIGVDEPDNVRQFRRQHGIRFDLLVAGFDGMELAQRLGNPQPVLPYTALIGADGHILGQFSGKIDEADLRRRLTPT
jgi:peroxiredoxin